MSVWGDLQYLPLGQPHFSLLTAIYFVLVAWILVRAFRLALTRIESVSMTFCNSDWRSGECCRLQLGAQLAEYLGPFPAPHTLTPHQRTPQKPSIWPEPDEFLTIARIACRAPRTRQSEGRR